MTLAVNDSSRRFQYPETEKDSPLLDLSIRTVTVILGEGSLPALAALQLSHRIGQLGVGKGYLMVTVGLQG